MQTLYCSTDLWLCSDRSNLTQVIHLHHPSKPQWSLYSDCLWPRPVNFQQMLALHSLESPVVVLWQTGVCQHYISSAVAAKFCTCCQWHCLSHKNNFVYSCWIVFMFKVKAFSRITSYSAHCMYLMLNMYIWHQLQQNWSAVRSFLWFPLEDRKPDRKKVGTTKRLSVYVWLC